MRPFVHACSDEFSTLVWHAGVPGASDDVKFLSGTEVAKPLAWFVGVSPFYDFPGDFIILSLLF